MDTVLSEDFSGDKYAPCSLGDNDCNNGQELLGLSITTLGVMQREFDNSPN